MNSDLQQLKYALQVLALPVTAQARLDVNEGCTAAALAQVFNKWRRVVLDESAEQLTAEQTAVLSRLNAKFAQMKQGCYLPDCSDLSLRTNIAWRQVRKIARQALVAFNWTLELPPHQAIIFQQVKGDRGHDQWSTIRQTCSLPNQSPGTSRLEMVGLV